MQFISFLILNYLAIVKGKIGFKFILFAVACMTSVSCTKSNEKKIEFINKNIEKTNKKNSDKYGELIIPDFLLDKDVAAAS